MAYSESLAERIRQALAPLASVKEQKMFGEGGFLVLPLLVLPSTHKTAHVELSRCSIRERLRGDRTEEGKSNEEEVSR